MELLSVALSPKIQCLAISPGQVLRTDDASNDLLRSSRGEKALGPEVEMPDGVRLRSGAPSDLAEMVVTLCRATPYLTGAVIPLDGGKSRY
jgi:NAD(P)-dependent dehydrogenase (short-subunit alcohol dehydrogenase family)